MMLNYTRKNGQILEFDNENAEQVAVVGDAMLEDGDPRAELIVLRRRLNALVSGEYESDPKQQRKANGIRDRIIMQLRQIRSQYFPDKYHRQYLVSLGDDENGLLAHASFKVRGADSFDIKTFDQMMDHPMADMVYGTDFYFKGDFANFDAQFDSVLALEMLERRTRWLSMATMHRNVHVDRIAASSLRDVHVDKIAASPNLRGLQILTLEGNKLGPACVSSLFNSVSLGALRRLDLAWNRITAEGMEAIANSKGLPELTGLDLGTTHIGNEGVLFLASAHQLKNLKWLLLDGNHIGDLGAQTIVESQHLQNLEYLNLSCNELSREWGFGLAQSKQLPKLRVFLSSETN